MSSCDYTLIERRRSPSGQRLDIHLDECHDSPRDWDNLGTIVCVEHREYELGDVRVSSTEELDEHLKSAAVKLPVYMLDHSGIYFRTEKFWEDPQGWDSGQIGYIYTTEERIRELYGDERPTDEKIKEALEGEIKTYSQYASGQVYCYTIFDVKKCSNGDEHEDVVDSCGGFYSIDHILDDTEAHDWTVEEDSD